MVPFINSLVDAVEKTVNISTSRGRLINDLGNRPCSGDLSAVVELSSSTFSGLLIVSFPQVTILNFVSRLTGEAQLELNSLVQSAVGEFTNIAVMSAKKKLNEVGYGLRVDIPMITTNSQLPAEKIANCKKCVVVPLKTALGEYFIDIRS